MDQMISGAIVRWERELDRRERDRAARQPAPAAAPRAPSASSVSALQFGREWAGYPVARACAGQRRTAR
jgi:hypothetical protein